VLVSRLRALLGGEAPIVTARAAGEGARAHYRLAAHVGFALIEPTEGREERASVPPARESNRGNPS
jgi:hypothetical protein